VRGGNIFISYRRDDTRADSGRLFDRLSVSFPGKVFRDVTSIEPGVEWAESIAHFLSQTDACIVLIGKNWLNATDSTGRRRLEDPRDTVRQEIAAVLRRKLRVFPVLVGGARMPAEEELPADLQALCRRNAIELTEHHWDEGMQRLTQALQTVLSQSGQSATTKSSAGPNRLPLLLGLAGAVIALIALAFFLIKRPAAAPNTADSTISNTGMSFAGNWRAVVNTHGARIDEDLESYPDHSFRLLTENTTVGIGKWQYNAVANSVEVTNATRLKDKAPFSCTWKVASASHDSLSGDCRDPSQDAWTVSLSAAPSSTAGRIYNIPHMDLSALSTAEKATISELLAKEQCRCGMTVLTCLRKHAACQYKEPLAQAALAEFVQTVHK
jgi:hypothetical protein